MGQRIPVQSQLKISSWKHYLSNYWDQQLVDLLHYGFPLDVDRSRQLKSTENNHKSAVDYYDHVSHYIAEELKHGAIYGPFHGQSFPCHISPFLTRHKPNSDNRRVIVDLSWPVGQSVNDGVALLFKFDISRAFRHLRIDPGDLDLLGLKHDSYYIDGTLAFRFRHGSVFLQRCTDALRYIMDHKFGYPNLLNYCDDLIYPALPHEINGAYTSLLSLLHDLGLEDISPKLQNIKMLISLNPCKIE